MPTTETLYVVAVLSNPERYAARYRLANDFVRRMQATEGVKLLLVEHSFARREFEIADITNPWHVRVGGPDLQEVWLKEALINLGIRHLTKLAPDWQKVLWVDADVEFTRPNWVQETLYEFDHSKVIQPWSHAIDLGPSHEAMTTFNSMYYCYRQGIPSITAPGMTPESAKEYGAQYWHSGFAWGIRRDAWDQLGGLLDWCIMGSGDHHMAWAFLGKVDQTVPGKITDGYRKLLDAWQDRAVQAVQGQVGYVRGTILHHWHGKKRERYYQPRWQILLDNQFDPITDVIYDDYHLPKLRGNKPALRDALRQYLRSRNEDSIDME